MLVGTRESRSAVLVESAPLAIVHSRRIGRSVLAEPLRGDGARTVGSFPITRTLADDLTVAPFDLVVVDHSTDDFDAARLCASLHRALGLPIVVSSPASRLVDEAWLVDTLTGGATAVVGADASPARLLAQIQATLRAVPRRSRPVPPIVLGDVTIDPAAQVVVIDGEPVSCRRHLVELLCALADAPGEVMSPEHLVMRAWGLEPTAPAHRVRIAIGLLRKLLGTGPRRPRIEAASTRGYRIIV